MSGELLTRAQQFIAEALDHHILFVEHVKEAKLHALDTGLAFLNAQAALTEQESFEDLIEPFITGGHISRGAAFKYTRFARDMMSWAVLEDPRLKRTEAIQAYAREMVLQSAKTFTDLMRDAAGVLAPLEGGGRRAEKPATLQQFFSFVAFDDMLWALEKTSFAPLHDLARDNREKLAESVRRAEMFVHAAKSALQEKTSAEGVSESVESATSVDSHSGEPLRATIEEGAQA